MMIDAYFTAVERGLRRKARLNPDDATFECIASDDFNGLLRCRATFWDGSFLDVYEVVSTEIGYPVRVHYAYTYVRQGHCVFRYDNAPHHPSIVTHPHHKHVESSRWPLPSNQPNLNEVLAEVESILGRRKVSLS
jgi:hypothetical protein